MRVKRLFSIILSVSMSIALMPILDLSTALANDTMIYEWDFRDYSGDEAVSSTVKQARPMRYQTMFLKFILQTVTA